MQLAKEVGVFALPAVVFFRANSEPTIYSGDLKNEDAILEWLLVQKDPSNEAIQEQSGENLQKTIDNSETVAVFLCKLSISGSGICVEHNFLVVCILIFNAF